MIAVCGDEPPAATFMSLLRTALLRNYVESHFVMVGDINVIDIKSYSIR